MTFPLWAGDSKNPKTAAREGNRKRTKYMRALRRAAGQEEVSLLRSGAELIGWLGGHGIDAT